MTTRPPITVAVPVYNGAAHLAETIESVLAQTFDDFELLISDDASTDGSLDVARSFRDTRIRLDSHRHLGMAGNWNRCVELARGEYLKVLPQDDLLGPDCLAKSLALLRSAPEAVLMFSRRHVIFDARDSSSAAWARRYRRLDDPLQPLESVNPGTVLLARWATQKFWGNLIGEPVTTVFPTDLARDLGGFPPGMHQDLDYALWIRLIARGDVCFSAESLCSFRLHRAGATSDNYASGRLTHERLRLLETLARDRTVRRQVPRLRWWLWGERWGHLARRVRGGR